MTHPKHIQLFFMAAVVFFSFALTACGSSQSHTAEQLVETSIPADAGTTDSSEGETSVASGNFKLAVCTKLNFSNVSWPKSMDNFDKNAFAIALTMSGSFEGHSGWNNISNNFDGQGLSLGLFNQNLGQGSLQPLMIRMRNKNTSKMKSFFSENNYNSLNTMLTKWQNASGFIGKATPALTENNWESNFSDLDNPEDKEAEEGIVPEDVLTKALSSNNRTSVSWAVANLYSGSSFKPAWKVSLQNLAQSPDFISQQLSAAEAIHKKASGYMNLGFTQLRSYLFFFDIVVQNGGLSPSVISNYKAWLKQNPNASETAKLTRILNVRLNSVRPQFVSDVRSRKMSIINGTGTVHGSARNYPKEYCVKNWNISINASGF